MDCARQIWHAEGIRGIFRGLNITIAREIPAFGIYFSSYELMTRREDATKPIGTFHMMMAGGWAGVFSWLFTYPIDFLKSRLQVGKAQSMHCEIGNRRVSLTRINHITGGRPWWPSGVQRHSGLHKENVSQ